MIRLEEVSFAAPAPPGEEARRLLGPVDFTASPGSSHLLLGSNGSGKTTLIRILAGLQPPSAGRYLLERDEIRVGPEGRSLWPFVAALFEEPDPQFLSDRVEAEVSFGLESMGLAPREIQERSRRIMEDLGIARLAARAPQSLSAGEKARTLLAAALAGRPRCLLLDQSLAHLDPGSRRELEGKVVREAIASGGVVVRTHQESDPPFPGEALHVVQGGRLHPLARLTPRAVLEESRAPFPLALRVSALLASIGRWSGPLAADAGELGRALGLDARPSPRPVPAATPRPTTFPGRPAALIMSGVAWSPPGRRAAPILDAIHLAVGKGTIAALLGRSGSGKSTLLKVAAGVLTPIRGSIQRPEPTVPRVRAVALALEYPERQLFGRTVLEDVAALLWVDGIPAEERARSARRAMTEVGLSPERFASRFPITLSEGEKRRAALAGVLVEPPQLLLLDEPTAGLDPEGKRALAQVLDRLRERERTVLLASHDLPFVAAVADHVFLLSREEDGPGGILAEGDPATILRDEALLARAGLPVPDYVRLESILREAGLLGPASGSARNESSLLDALARGGSVQPT